MNLSLHKKRCKRLFKVDPCGLTLMQFQHKYAKSLGYLSWMDLRKGVENG